ncbi:DUF6513 domain-containing protein [Rosistilla oblonga]|uniref:DUF6513 domain-containing protein n=1 Tax=Rosistilla oblonga TaxID=2527990 RepID=UPI003A98343B
MENASKNDGLGCHYHFITGRLAEHSLRQVVESVAARVGFEYSIGVMPITVAALITPKWLARHLDVPAQATAVILPGYCVRGLAEIDAMLDVPVQCGPKDLSDLPNFFSLSNKKRSLNDFDIEIVAEINHAPSRQIDELLALASGYAACGADIIDLGCNPEQRWDGIKQVVPMLRDLGLRVSIDTLDPIEAADACAAGAELVLSVNRSNREMAVDWGTEVVVIPDTPDAIETMDETAEYLTQRNVPIRLDPILEPIGFGFAASLNRYIETRRRHPDAAMMMGIGNLSELTDVDSAGVNFLLLGICQELGIQSVLTTQVINWARSSVAECDLARRMVYAACKERIPPKNLSDALVMLRDPRLNELPAGHTEQLADRIKDNNFRLFAQADEIRLVSRDLHLVGDDPFEIFEALLATEQGEHVDASHAFYLGFEMCKALTAITLGKRYEQDESLRWGHLTRDEKHHRLSGKRRQKKSAD